MTTALVTGATAGLGLIFARRLAAAGHDLVLVARDQQRLDQVAAEIGGQHGCRVDTLSADLTDRADTQRIAARLADPAAPVDVLVNNAGFGLGKSFLESTLDEEERLLAIHCHAVLLLARAAAHAMKDRGHGTIINVSSVAGFAAMGTYSAAKAWSTAFTESIAGQLAPHGIRVMALCPGFVRTEFHGRAAIDMASMPGIGWLDAERVVDDALADVAKGRVVSVPSKRFKAVAFVCRHAPRPLVRRFSGGLQRRRAQPTV